MNCFQLIKTVLDEAYDTIPGDESQRDEAVKAALPTLSRRYGQLIHKGCIDYTDPAIRFAYIYCYMAAHANMVYQTMPQSNTLGGLFDRKSLAVACIGGGPGSDLLGILKYCLEFDKTPELTGVILDRDCAWRESWEIIEDKLDFSIQLSVSFQQVDITDSEGRHACVRELDADLFTFIYSVSEMHARQEEVESCFSALFDGMRPGAMILFVDNNDSRFCSWFDELLAEHHINILKKGKRSFQMPFEEKSSDLGIYFDKFRSPQLQADIAYRIAEKADG